MGLQVTGDHQGSKAEMNIVPLIDVLLVLLIIFMVITPLTPAGMEAALPSQTGEERPPVDVIVVSVGSKESLRMNGETQTWSTLAVRLEEILQTRAQKVAFVAGESDVEFAQIARAIDLMRGAGIERVGLLTRGPMVVQP